MPTFWGREAFSLIRGNLVLGTWEEHLLFSSISLSSQHWCRHGCRKSMAELYLRAWGLNRGTTGTWKVQGAHGKGGVRKNSFIKKRKCKRLKHIKRYSISFRERKLKPCWGITSHLSDGKRSKRLTTYSVILLWGNRSFHSFMVGRQNGTTSMELNWQYLQNSHFLFDPEIPFPSINPKTTL